MTQARTAKTPVSWVAAFVGILVVLHALPLLAQAPSFLPAVTYPTAGGRAYSVAVADVNGDGRPDLIVGDCCGGNDGLVSVLLGNGDGSFQPPVSFNTGGLQAAVVAVADLNGDRKSDIVVTNSYWSNSVGVLLGNGDGSFRPVVTYPSGGGGPWSVVIADLNADGNPDLVLALSSSCYGCTDGALAAVLLGNGDGSFQPAVTYSSGGYAFEGAPISAAVADLNADGKLDIAITNECSGDFECSLDGSVGILLGNGDGTFQPVVTYPPKGAGLLSVAIGDVNGDGKQDLMVTNGCGPGACSKGTITVLLGNGDGTYQSPVAYDSGGYGTGAAAVADVNGDGKLDLVVANACDLSTGGNCAYVGTSGVVGVLQGNGDGTFQAPQVYGSGGYWVSNYVTVADVDADSKPDILVVNLIGQPDGQPYSHGSIGVLLNNPSRISTTTTVASSPNPSVYGQAVTIAAHVTSDSGRPMGTVQILNGSAVVGSGTLSSGSVSIPVSTLPAGTDLVTGSYPGGGGFAPSKSAPLTQTVTKAATATSLASSLNPAATNQAITLTAAVSSQYGGAATGTVIFIAGAQNLGSAALSGNVASLTTSFATTGTYSIKAHYNGDSNNTGSTSGVLSERIIVSTTTTLTSSLNPSVVGQAVTFTATVGSSGGNLPNGETVTFYNGSAVLGTAPLSGGAAALTTSGLPAGAITITARYPGDSNFAPSTSAGLRQTVNSTTKSATATSLASSLNPSTYGQKITFMAQVTTSGQVPPAGTVVFMWRYFAQTYTIGTATLNSSGVATLTKSNLNEGLYPMTAVYRGDTNNLSSTSTLLNQTVLQTTSKTTLASSPNPSTVGQAVTFTAKITSPTVTPTGPVTFTLGKTALGTAQLSGGKATFTTSSLAAGSNVIKVTYYGNSNIARSSAVVTQVVQ